MGAAIRAGSDGAPVFGSISAGIDNEQIEPDFEETLPEIRRQFPIAQKLSRARAEVARLGYAGGAKSYLRGLTVRFLLKRLLRSFIWPPLEELLSTQSHVISSPAQVVALLFPEAGIDLEDLCIEFQELQAELDARTGRIQLPPDTCEWAIEAETAFLLYVVVRLTRPALVVETGVANGASTYYFLHALTKNQVGRLVSTDVKSDVGKLISDGERGAWQLHCLNERSAGRDFEAIISSLPPIDVFFHDSDHTYRAQTLEYRIAFNALKEGGLLISDDVNYSYAFADFCKQHGLDPIYVLDRRKVIGIARVQKPK
jgi:predicted O-methyltransferase YrrM